MSDLTLRPQDLRLGRLLQRVRDAVVVADSTTGRILLWNQTATRVFGYSSSEALGLVFEDLVPGLFEERHGAGAPSQSETGDAAYVGSRELLRLPAVRKGGEEITVEMSLSPVEQLNGHGEAGGRFVLAIVRDATERERTYDRLVESERRFATVLSNTRAYVYRCFNEPGYPNEFASDYALELTGYPPQDLLVDGGVRFGDLIVEEDRGRVWAELQEALAARRSFALRYAIRRKDGATRRVEEFGRGIYDEEGNVEALEGIVYDVTDVALTEERLREAEARYRQLVERLPAIVYVEEMNGRMSTVYDSPQIETMLGYPRDKYVEDPDYWAKILHPDDRERVLAGERRAIASGESLSQEYRVVARDGRTVWVRDEAVIVRGRDEDRSYFQGLIFDITERKEAERRLQEAEARYRTLVEQIPAVTYIQEIVYPSRTTYVSPQMETMLGYTPEECTSDPQHWIKILHPDDRDRVLALDLRTNETGEPFRAEFRQFAKDGRVVWIRDEATLVRDGEGNPSYWLGVQYDVTERKEAERRLREAEARYRTLVEQMPAVVYIQEIEHQGAISYISPQIEELMGYSAEEYLQDPDLWVRATHPDDRERVLAEDARTDETGEPFSMEFRKITRDGRVIWVRDEAVLVRDAGDRPLHWQGILTDITERRRTEGALRESEERYRTLVQYGSDIITILEADGTIRYESPAAERVLGYRPEEMVGTSAFDYVHPDDLEAVLETFLEGIATRWPTATAEYRVPHADGSWRRVESIGVNLLDDPAVRGIMVTSRDVTERRQAEEALQRSEASLSEAQRMAHLGSWEWNVRTREVRWSDEVFRIFGFEPRSFSPTFEVLLEVVHPDDRTKLEDAKDDAFYRGKPQNFEHRIVRPSGEVRVVHCRAEVVFDERGGPIKMVGTIQDVTELKRTERAWKESEQRFRQLFEQSVDALFVHDEKGRFVDCNSQACRLLGYSREELLDLSVSDISLNILAEEERKAKEEGGGTLWQRALAGTPGTFALSHEEQNVRKDGTVFPAEVRVGSVDYGGRRMILASVRDITERKRAEEELRRNEARHRAVLDNAFDAVITASADGTIRSFNRRAETMFGYGAEEVIGRQLALLMPEHAPNGSARYVEEYRPGRTFEVAARRKDGTEFPIELSIAEVREGDDVFLTGIVRDITERKLFEAQLTYQALHDPLTRLPNRTLFLDRLEQALAQTRRRQNVNVAVLFMDLDDFKNVNDSLGHDVGDELLKAVGTRLKSRLRPGDTAARLGGDEFAILLEDVRGVEDASLVARRMIEDIKAPFVLMGYELFFTVSIGISLSTSERDRAEEMLRDADLAMYQAKEKGKATYQVFDSAMYGRVLDRLSLDRDLRRACRRDEFVIHYQPKVRLQTGRIFGVEALVRWDRPGRGLVLPEEFVPVAEENGLIVPIGRRTLEEACRRASEWRERYPHDLFEMVSVNLSASQLQHAYLLEETVATLHRTGLDPRNLNLEITESVVMSDVPTNAATLDKLRELGIELAIDDFGKGYSSLSYLKRFPVSYLKVDRSFVEELREGSEDRALVSGIIALAHTLGMRVIAEGVESAEQLRILRELGCDMAQGFYFSKPLTHEGVSELLASDPRW